MAVDRKWIQKIVVGLLLTALISYNAWLVLQITDLQVRVGVLEKTTVGIQQDCASRDIRARALDASVNQIRVDVAFIRGRMEGDK